MRHLLIEQMPHFILGNTAQFVGSVGDAFSAICCLQIFRFTSSKPSKSAIASDEKFIRLRTNSFVRYCRKKKSADPALFSRKKPGFGLTFPGKYYKIANGINSSASPGTY